MQPAFPSIREKLPSCRGVRPYYPCVLLDTHMMNEDQPPEPGPTPPCQAVQSDRPTFHVPLDLPRLIMRRAGLVALAGVFAMTWLGLFRMQDNVREELAGARAVAQLAERLSTLPLMEDGQAVRAMRQWRADGELRHLSFHLLDGAGHDLLDDAVEASAPSPAALDRITQWLVSAASDWFPAPAPFTVAWAVPRPASGPWTVRLSADADSEQREALLFVFEGVLTLALVSAGMLLAMTWNTRAAFRPLAGLLSAIAHLRAGEREPLNALPTMAVGEMESIAGALRELADALAQAERERQWLAQKMLTLQEDERQRLARELHDEFGQRLTALRVDAAWLAKRVAGQEDMVGVVAGMSAQCELIQQDIRAVLARLQPLGSASGDAGRGGAAAQGSAARLGRLMHDLAAAWRREGDGGLAVQVHLSARSGQGQPNGDWPADDNDEATLPMTLMLAIYRITQEALTNVARHANASQTLVSLHWREATAESAAAIEWSVQDDGVGVTDLASALRRGNGLAGIKERVWASGADLVTGPADAGRVPPGWRLAAQFTWPQPGAVTLNAS